MKKSISQHPYAVTSAIFLLLLVLGLFYLDWRKDDFMFILLLFFIVTLSIRLDEISRQIGSGRQTASDTDESLLSMMKEIRTLLRESNHRLQRIQDRLHRDDEA